MKRSMLLAVNNASCHLSMFVFAMRFLREKNNNLHIIEILVYIKCFEI